MSLPTSARTPVHAPGLAAAGVSLVAVCYGLARFAYGLFVPVLREDLDLAATTVGVVAASSYVAYAVAILVSVPATARLGPRAVAVVAGACATVGTATIASAQGAVVLAVGVVVAGCSTGLVSPALAGAVSWAVEPHRRDRVQTVVNAGTGLGVAASGPVALLVTDDWRTAWWLFAAVSAVVTVWASVTVPRVTSATAPARGRGLPRRALPSGAGRLLTASAVLGLGSSAVWTFGRDVASASGLGASASAVLWIVLGASGLLAALTGDLIARWGLRAAWGWGMAALAAATIGFVSGRGAPAVVFLAAAVFGAVYVALTGAVLVWATQTFREAPARGVGLGFLAIAVGQAVGSALVGLVGEVASPTAAFAAASVATLAGATVRPPVDRAVDGAVALPLSRSPRVGGTLGEAPCVGERDRRSP